MVLLEGIALGVAAGWQFVGAPLMAFRLGMSAVADQRKFIRLALLIVATALFLTVMTIPLLDIMALLSN